MSQMPKRVPKKRVFEDFDMSAGDSSNTPPPSKKRVVFPVPPKPFLEPKVPPKSRGKTSRCPPNPSERLSQDLFANSDQDEESDKSDETLISQDINVSPPQHTSTPRTSQTRQSPRWRKVPQNPQKTRSSQDASKTRQSPRWRKTPQSPQMAHSSRVPVNDSPVSRAPRTPKDASKTRQSPRWRKAPQSPQMAHSSQVHTQLSSLRATLTPSQRTSKGPRTDRFPLSDKKFQRTVIGHLLDIKDDLRRNAREGEPEGRELFNVKPLETEDEFDRHEEDLEKADFRRQTTSTLTRIGGKTFRDCTNKMLDRYMTNAVMSLFNMNGGGQRKKRPFKETALYRVILEAVMTMHKAKEVEVRLAMSEHLKQAPGRTGGSGYRKNT